MRKWGVAAVAAVVLVVLGVVAFIVVRDARIEAAECSAVAVLRDKTAGPIGTGEPLTVVGDSYTQGWGLDDPRQSWVASLGRKVTVRAASGAGYTQGGLCHSAPIPALADGAGGSVVVQAGLNDVDGSGLADEVRRTIGEAGVVALVGPALAPSLDEGKVRAVDATLAKVAAESGVKYVSAIGWDLSYTDGLHLTPGSHREFGLRVAARL